LVPVVREASIVTAQTAAIPFLAQLRPAGAALALVALVMAAFPVMLGVLPMAMAAAVVAVSYMCLALVVN
jgi:hypothetical protein